MVIYTPTDLIDIAEFEFSWRILDSKWDHLPDDIIRQIHAFAAERSEKVYRRGAVLRHVGAPYVNVIDFHVNSDVSLEGEITTEMDAVKRWMRGLAIEPETEIYVTWSSTAVVATVWRLFMEYWDSFWYPFDDVNVFDETLNWGVLFGPEEFAVYVKAGPASLSALPYERAAGFDLVRAIPPGSVARVLPERT